MNGLLTALLGGAAGAGQGIQYQDELAMKQQAQKMERLSMATEMIKNGITPPKDLLAGFDLGTPTQGPPQGTTPSGPDMQTSNGPTQGPTQGPGPSIPQGVLTGLMVRHGDGFVAAPNAQQSAPPAMQPAVQSTQPGGMSGTDAIRGAASSPGFMMPTPMTVGGLQVDLSRSLPYRTAMLGVAADQMKDQNQAAIAEQKIARDAQAILDANQVNPNTGRPFTPAEATNIARNHDLAMQRAPVLGTPNYSTAMLGDRQQAANIDLDKAIRMAPVTASTAAQTLAATTPGEVDKAARMAPVAASAAAQSLAATTPGEVAKKAQMDSAAYPSVDEMRAAAVLPQAKAAAATIKQFAAPGVLTGLAQHYGSIANYFDSPDGQVFRQAITTYANSKMDATGQQRLSPAQIRATMSEYIPEVGDKDEVIKKKLGELDRGIQGIRVSAGRAAKMVEPQYSPNNPFAPKVPQ